MWGQEVAGIRIEPRAEIPPLLEQQGFVPAVLWRQAFSRAVIASKRGVPIQIGLGGREGGFASHSGMMFDAGKGQGEDLANRLYLENVSRSLLCTHGGCQFLVDGRGWAAGYLTAVLNQLFPDPDGVDRAFDSGFIQQVYDRPIEVGQVMADRMPPAAETIVPIGRDLTDLCLIGLDIGAGDLRVDVGHGVAPQGFEWSPVGVSDTDYRVTMIMQALRAGAVKLPRVVHGVAVSAAGIISGNRVRVATWCRGLQPGQIIDVFSQVERRVREEWNARFLATNDGDTGALAWVVQSLDKVLSLPMGSDLAGGLAGPSRSTRLVELAFKPICVSPTAPIYPWPSYRGCAGMFLSQKAIPVFAPLAGIELPQDTDVRGQLQYVQTLLAKGDERARHVFEAIGAVFGYVLMDLDESYPAEFANIPLAGRLTEGEGGPIIKEWAERVLKAEAPTLAERLNIFVPSEKDRIYGQAGAVRYLFAQAN